MNNMKGKKEEKMGLNFRVKDDELRLKRLDVILI